MSNSPKKEGIGSMIKLGLTLAIYAAVSCTVLALVNNVTAPVIEKNQANKASGAMKAVFADADGFEAVTDFTSSYGSITIESVYLAKKGGKTIGGAAQVSGPTYDQGTIIVGLGKDGIVTGMQVLKNTDSPGFGQKAGDPNFKLASGQTFYGQFTGKAAKNGFTVGETVDAISGATISSMGFSALVQAGTDTLTAVLAGEE